MLKNTLFSATVIALAISAGTALAANLPHYKAPPPPPPPVFSWTGIYGGINIGYGFGSRDREYGYELFHEVSTFIAGGGPFVGSFHQLGGPSWNRPTNLNAVIGGGQAGANYQFNRWLVLGVETDIQGSGLSSRAQSIGAGNSCLFGTGSAVPGQAFFGFNGLTGTPGFGPGTGVPYLGIANSTQHVD